MGHASSPRLPTGRPVGQAEEFAEHARVGEALGVAHVEAGPLVRSGYHAGKQLQRARGATAAVSRSPRG
jgi:lipoate synthase